MRIPKEIMDDFAKTSEKLIKGYQALQNVKEVDVATTPKTLVWQSDLVKLYHYNRETPAKCKADETLASDEAT